MAATKPKTCLNALTAAALALPGINQKSTAGTPAFTLSPQAGFEYAHYEETGNRMAVDIYHGALSSTVTDRLELSASYDFDTYAGATPAYSLPESTKDIVFASNSLRNLLQLPEAQDILNDLIDNQGIDSSAAIKLTVDSLLNKPIDDNTKTVEIFEPHPRENRRSFTIGARYDFDAVGISLSGGNSDEPDYVSDFGSMHMSWTVNQKLTTLNAAFSYRSDTVKSNTDSSLEESKIDRSFDLGISQVVSKNALVHANVSYTNSSGFLSNVYKKVYVRGEMVSDQLRETNLPDVFFENRPGKRHQLAIVGRYLLHFPDFDASFHSNYRFFNDSWGIEAHTFELSWHQSLPANWLITPSLRYYSQSEADFFAPFFLGSRAHHEYSSDFRLSAFGALSGGIQLSKTFFDETVSINVNFEYTTHQNDLKLSGGANSSYADINFYLVTAGIQLKF